MIFGLSYFRIGAYVVIAIIIGYLIYQYRTGQEAKHQVSVITAERDKAIADHNAYIAIRAAQDSITAKVSTDYENAITDLVGQLNAARDANNHIRLCHTMPKANAPSTATSQPNETSQDGSNREAEQVVSTSQLYEIAGEAAECGERLNHLQDWIRQQAAVN